MMKPIVLRPDEDSFMIEWVSSSARFGISLESNPSECSWFYVHKDGESACGQLPQTFFDALQELCDVIELANTEPYGVNFILD